jgi:hypothetical protein
MQNIGGVHEEKSPEDLVDEVLDMFITQFLSGVDDPMQISFHEFSDDVNVRISSLGLRAEDVDQSDDIIMFEEL